MFLHDCCSVAKSCPTLCKPTDCSTPGLPVLRHLPELAPTHVHWVHLIFCGPLLLLPQSFPASGSFPMSQLFASGGQSIGVSALASVLPVNIQDWFPLQLTGLISSQSRYSRESSPTPQLKSINFLPLSILYGPTLTSIHDYWENHSFDYTDLCQQSDVSAF